MIPVFQTDTTETNGNCFAACVASMLECSIDHVPNFYEGTKREMTWIARKWLLEKFNLTIVSTYLQRHGNNSFIGATPGMFFILGIESRHYRELSHAVIAKVCEDGQTFEVIHDPNPINKMEKHPWGEYAVGYFMIPMDYKNNLYGKEVVYGGHAIWVFRDGKHGGLECHAHGNEEEARAGKNPHATLIFDNADQAMKFWAVNSHLMSTIYPGLKQREARKN